MLYGKVLLPVCEGRKYQVVVKMSCSYPVYAYLYACGLGDEQRFFATQHCQRVSGQPYPCGKQD